MSLFARENWLVLSYAFNIYLNMKIINRRFYRAHTFFLTGAWQAYDNHQFLKSACSERYSVQRNKAENKFIVV